MGFDVLGSTDAKWIKVGDLLIDLNSMERGFRSSERDRRDIWDYIEWRETVLTGPPDRTCRHTSPI
jgi:hypothetical protein